jgi:NTP pyrophosphatase (non-canonical NTP hydrolase)
MIEMADASQLSQMQADVVQWCKVKGWWDDGRTFGDSIALLHSELSEALEAFRDHGLEDATQQSKVGTPLNPGNSVAKPEGVGSEFADVLVRLFHACALYDIDLEAEFERKMAYNWRRSFRHGGKSL